ncbi:nucleoside diphosphate kinase, putative [Eimeria acervulina]|uniref:Nucleoside diphosphate kinase, putative n=1 Tax=Eimeria acervulina TaxID=5801 RepID=U6GGD9_EIMAC|nr:nucleoside diphosphate kinase, putative [Eimeria acervulina]CDI79240.1 nucleoside diphosphate kinase, putative [Eimeria acervulina]
MLTNREFCPSGTSSGAGEVARVEPLAQASVPAMTCHHALLQNRGLLHTADLSSLKREGLAAAPEVLQQLLQQAVAKQLQARVLLLHGPPRATAAAAAAAKDVLPAVVVADAEALLCLEQQQQRQQEEQQEWSSCLYCGDVDASCECLSDGKAKRILLVGDDDPVRLREELSSILRCEVAALVAPKGLATVALGKAVAHMLGLRLIPDFELFVKQQRQRQHEQGSAATETAGTTKPARGLAKAIQQANGRLRAPAVVAEALRALRRPQSEGLGNGVLLLDMLDSVELAEELESRQLPLTRVIILEAPQETLEAAAAESGGTEAEDANDEEGKSRLVRDKKIRDQIAAIYKDRCVRIQLSAAAAAAALAPPPTSSSDGDNEGPTPAELAAAEAKAAAAAVQEIAAALMKPAAFILADGLLQPEAAAAVRQGLVQGLSNKLLVLDRKHLAYVGLLGPLGPSALYMQGCSLPLPLSPASSAGFRVVLAGFPAPAELYAQIRRLRQLCDIQGILIMRPPTAYTDPQVEGCTATEISPKIGLLLQQLQQPRELSPLEELQLNPPAPEPLEKEGSQSEEEEEEA